MPTRDWKYEEIVARFLDFSQQVQANQNTRLPCRITHFVSNKLLSSCHVAEVQCDHCRRLNSLRPKGAPEIPCIVSNEALRCAICCVAQVYRYDCCDVELKERTLNSQDSRYMTSHRLSDRIAPCTNSLPDNPALPRRSPSSAPINHTTVSPARAARGLQDRLDRPPTGRDNAAYFNKAADRTTESRARTSKGAATNTAPSSNAWLDPQGSKSGPKVSTVSPTVTPRTIPLIPTEKQAQPSSAKSAESQKIAHVKTEEEDHQLLLPETKMVPISIILEKDSSIPAQPGSTNNAEKLETADTKIEGLPFTSLDVEAALSESADEKMIGRILRAFTSLCGKSQGCACKAKLESLTEENAKLRRENDELKHAEDLSRKRKERDFDRSQEECQKLRKTMQWCQENMSQMIERLESGGEDRREGVDRTIV